MIGFVIKARMLTADGAKIFLTDVKDQSAKSPLVKMRASVVFTKLKMRSFFKRNAFLYRLAVAILEPFVLFERFRVDIDLPADTAAVIALVSDAFEFFVIFGCVKLHISAFLPSAKQ